MKITVMGVTGLIGKNVVALLNEAGHQTVSASRRSGADVLTGEGLAAALSGADVLVDVTNAPVPDAPIQPIAAADVAAEVARAAQARPVNGVVNIGGPEQLRFADLANLVVAHKGGSASVIVDPSATYFGSSARVVNCLVICE